MEIIIIKLLSAVIIGGAIGLERKSRSKPAGLITNILVCMGATIISIEQGFLVERALMVVKEDPSLSSAVRIDMGRLTAQIISGMGFLGGGVIIQSKGSVKGITTAATLWVVAAIGIVIGNGHLIFAYTSGIFVLIVLIFLKKWEVIALDKRKIRKLYLEYYECEEVTETIIEVFKEKSIRVSQKKTLDKKTDGELTLVKRLYTLNSPKYVSTKQLLKELIRYEDIVIAEKRV